MKTETNMILRRLQIRVAILVLKDSQVSRQSVQQTTVEPLVLRVPIFEILPFCVMVVVLIDVIRDF